MSNCINKNHPDVAKLAGELNILPAVAAAKIGVWQSKNNIFDRFPTKDELNKKEEVNYNLKAVDILSSDKAKQVFDKGQKNKWSLDKILTELQIPKEQKQLILDLNITDREKIISNIEPTKGVPELFESNPELANTVYEALGFETELPSYNNIIETDNKKDKKEKLEQRRELVLREINAIEQLIKTNPDEITVYHSKPYKGAYEVIKYFDKNNWEKDDSKYKESIIITKPSYLHNHLEEELQKRIKNLQIINSSLFSDVEKVNYSNIFKEGKSYSSVEVLKYVSDNKKDVLSGIAKTLIKYAEKNNVEIQIVEKAPKTPAGAYFYSNKIKIYGNKNVTSHTLIHEIIHSFSSDYIRNNSKSLPILQLENILKNILDKKILKEYSNFEGSYEDYATKNIHELLSEIISRPDILSHLALYDTNYNLVKDAYKKETLLDKIIKTLSDIFNFSKNEIETLSDLILFNARDIFEASPLWSEFNRNQITSQQKQQAQQIYSQYLDTIFPDSKVVEMDNSLYISVLNQLEQENKIEKDCTGGGKLKAKDGITTLFEKGGKWELVTDFKNAPTHKAGGKDISIQGKKVEIEKNELRIENDFGDVAVIPSKYRVEVKDAIKSNCHSCIDGIVESLPKMKDYAGDGTVFPFFGRYKRFKNSLPDNLKNTSEDEYAMRYYWKHNNKPKSFDEAIKKEQPMFTMEDDGYYHAPSVEPNTLRFLKPKNHPTLQYELDWYNSDNPDAVDFKSKYDLDTSGKFYKYVPKKK